MSFIFNKGQRDVINAAIKWWNSSEQVFEFAGNPGTGKSVVLNEIINRLGLDLSEVAPMAYTGAAAIVMRMKGLINAKTSHSWLYEPVITPLVKNGEVMMDTYFNKPITHIDFVSKDLTGIRLIAIDEGRMVPYSMRNEILRRGIKVLVTGDPDQLDPVADKPAFLTGDNVMILNEIVRQAENSSIVYLSQRLKHGLPIASGFYGDTWVTTEDEITPEIILNSDILLCGKNATRDKYNKLIREQFLNIRSDLPITGEKVICRKNNWQIECSGINLANGLTGRVINNPGVGGFDGKTFRMDFVPDLLNAVFKDLQCDYRYFIAPYNQREAIKNNRYNVGEKFEFGYASTVHLAQGSQFNNGIYIEEYLHPDINWKINYTAITRFASRGIYVKPKQRIFY